MNGFSIQGFWEQRIRASGESITPSVNGWFIIDKSDSSFVEAPLHLSSEFEYDVGPEISSLILVSAAGAVGKSTLAKEIAHCTGAVYIDLALSEPVGDNTLAGGLVKSNLYDRWQDQSITVLIDGLDEARLRVTQQAFEAFLHDIFDLSSNRKLPTILFGRSSSVQDVWLSLADYGVQSPVLEIGYFSDEDALTFVEAKLRAINPSRPHQGAERRAITLLLTRLREQTKSDGDRFAGYAPVLQAVAARMDREGNPGALVAELEQGAQPLTLQHVTSAIMDRERTKLDRLDFEDAALRNKLYLADEQLARLAARVYGDRSPDLPVMSAVDAQTYENALDTWVADHPFLDSMDRPSSAVFDAVIATWVLIDGTSRQVRDTAVKRELSRGPSANPFLAELYENELKEREASIIPTEHIGILYASLRARLSLGDSANLSIEEAENRVEDELQSTQVEMICWRRGIERPSISKFQSERGGEIRLGTHIADVEVNAPESHVEIGSGAEAVLVAPISIQCLLLSISVTRMIVESSSAVAEACVFLEAEELDAPTMMSVPVLRGRVRLQATWPDVQSHPWTAFATDPTPVEDPRIDEALRRLRRFVISFRSHSQGSLARFQGKIEQDRMTKGTGMSVLKLMLKEEIVTKENAMYYLDPQRLAACTDVHYADCMARRFSAKAIEFVKRAL